MSLREFEASLESGLHNEMLSKKNLLATLKIAQTLPASSREPHRREVLGISCSKLQS